MSTIDFATGKAPVGHVEMEFAPRIIRNKFQMYVPTGFSEDKNLVSNYTYLFCKDKSPLSIAIKYSPASNDRPRHISHYFSRPMDSLSSAQCDSGNIYYRETVTDSNYLSVYSLRFAVEVVGGLLFGCFNCSAVHRDDWRSVVLAMLRDIQPV